MMNKEDIENQIKLIKMIMNAEWGNIDRNMVYISSTTMSLACLNEIERLKAMLKNG